MSYHLPGHYSPELSNKNSHKGVEKNEVILESESSVNGSFQGPRLCGKIPQVATITIPGGIYVYDMYTYFVREKYQNSHVK